MQRILIAALGALMLVAFNPADVAAQDAHVTADLNVRTGPGTGYGRIGVVPRGGPVDILSCGGGWCRIRYGGLVGYVSGNYLSRGYAGGPVYATPPVYAPAPRFYSFSWGIGPRYHYPRRHWRHRHHWRHGHWGHRGHWGGRPGHRWHNPNRGRGQR